MFYDNSIFGCLKKNTDFLRLEPSLQRKSKAVIRAYLLIKFGQKFQSTLLLEPPLVLET